MTKTSLSFFKFLQFAYFLRSLDFLKTCLNCCVRLLHALVSTVSKISQILLISWIIWIADQKLPTWHLYSYTQHSVCMMCIGVLQLWISACQPWKSSEVMGSLMRSGAPSIRATAASRLSFITATWRAVSPREPEQEDTPSKITENTPKRQQCKV